MVVLTGSKLLHFVVYSYLVVNPVSASVIYRQLHHDHHAHRALPLDPSNVSTPVTLTPVPTSSEVSEDVHSPAEQLKDLASALEINLDFLFPSPTRHHHATSRSRNPIITIFPTFHPPSSLHHPSDGISPIVPLPTATGSRILDGPLTRSVSFHLPTLPPQPSLTLSTIFLYPTPIPLGHIASVETVNVTIHRTSLVHITRTVSPLPSISAESPTATAFIVGLSVMPFPTVEPSTNLPHFSLHMPIPVSLPTSLLPKGPSSLLSTLKTLPTPSLLIPTPTPTTLLSSPVLPTSITPFNPLSTPLTLTSLCTSPSIKTISLPLLSSFFGPDAYPSLHLFPGCTAPNPSQTQHAPGLLNCSALGAEVQKCQDRGVKVLLTIRSATVAQNNNSTTFPGTRIPMPSNPNITAHAPIPVNALPKPSNVPADASQLNLFTDLEQADKFASTLWSLFGGGHLERADLRPLGPDVPAGDPTASQKGGGGGVTWFPRPLGREVVVDGFDVGMERAWEGSVEEGFFGGLVERLKSLAAADRTKKHLILGVSLV